MKKIFTLIDEKKKPARMVEAAKSTINKYIKRERNKKLPEGFDYVDFDCKFGYEADEASEIHLSKLFKAIDGAEQDEVESFYVEVLPVGRVRGK
ncbi:DUF6172 family protein [Rubritalea spongiae]|uniref:DUF6172 family protein n=1 Tax=Rubritalea spongiae TaxID=430797 RepID=A0ABW5E719_9BACT